MVSERTNVRNKCSIVQKQRYGGICDEKDDDDSGAYGISRI